MSHKSWTLCPMERESRKTIFEKIFEIFSEKRHQNVHAHVQELFTSWCAIIQKNSILFWGDFEHLCQYIADLSSSYWSCLFWSLTYGGVDLIVQPVLIICLGANGGDGGAGTNGATLHSSILQSKLKLVWEESWGSADVYCSWWLWCSAQCNVHLSSSNTVATKTNNCKANQIRLIETTA